MADSFSLTPDEIAALARLKNWDIYKVTSTTVSKLKHIERRKDVIGCYASGDANAIKNLNGTNASGGIDMIVRETQRKPGEPECNIYHYTLEANNNGGSNQVGPFRDQTILPHWPKGTTEEVLSKYDALSKGEI